MHCSKNITGCNKIPQSIMFSQFIGRCRVSCGTKCNVFSRKQSLQMSNDNPFAVLGVKPRLVQALQNEGVLYPTEIQRLALPKTIAGKHCVIHSETGTGKSLTFLVPALQDSATRLSTVVVTPTRELGAQLHYMADRLCRGKRIVSLFSGVDNDLTVMHLSMSSPTYPRSGRGSGRGEDCWGFTNAGTSMKNSPKFPTPG